MSGTVYSSAIGSFVIGLSPIESYAWPLLQTVPIAYPYLQFSDDENVSAFFTAYTNVAQGYLNWFNATPLSVYTDAAISGSLLDWIGQGVYGIARPVLSSVVTSTTAGLGTRALGTYPLNTLQAQTAGTAQVASDDVYKRCLTWALYKGDGNQASIAWVRRRTARWIYGANGSDVAPDDFSLISVSISGTALTITVPNTSTGQLFQQCVGDGILAFPFQVSASVALA